MNSDIYAKGQNKQLSFNEGNVVPTYGQNYPQPQIHHPQQYNNTQPFYTNEHFSGQLKLVKQQKPYSGQALPNGSLTSNAKLNFIRKVYTILIFQLIITIGVCLISYFVQPFLKFQLENYWIMYASLGLVIIMAITIQCCEFSRRHPINLILLLIFTVCFSYIVSFTTSLYAKNYGGPLVISAAIITIVVVAGLTVYAVFTKTDFTTHIGIIIVVIISFSVFGLLCIGNWNPVLYNLYCALGVIIGGILLILDTQSIVGGQRSFEIPLDDYTLGALILYMDIIRLFLIILRLGGANRN